MHHRLLPPAALALCLAAPQWAFARQSGTDSQVTQTIESSPLVLPAITVHGTLSDGTTEGSGLYTSEVTSTATGLSLSARDTPQSVSVVTSTQIADQGLRDAAEILQSVTGVSMSRNDSNRVSFSSRGFSINNFQFDGLSTPILGQWNYGDADFDSAIYDRVEVVRGATGLMTGSGEPSAAVNFIRKRPLKEFAASAELGAGSKETRRAMADISVPFTDDAQVRSRLVTSWSSNESHVTDLDFRKRMFYGIISADLTPSTVLDIGVQYQANHSNGFGSGFPLFYSDGSRTNFNRSVSNNTRWAYLDTKSTTTFLDLNHRFANEWKVRAAYSHNDGDYLMKHLYRGGYPDRNTGLGMSSAFNNYDGKRLRNDWHLSVSGPFQWLGQTHEVSLGWMRISDHSNIQRYLPLTTPPIGSFFDWRNNTIAEPQWASSLSPADKLHTLETGGYAVGRFALSEAGHVIIGARVSNWEIDQTSFGSLRQYKVTDEITPYAGLTWDLGEQYTAYVSYTEIFQPQNARAVDASLLPPVTGKSYEIGVKASWLDGLLDGTLSVYRTRQSDLAEAIPGATVTGMPGVQAYRTVSGATVEGFDVALTGQIRPNWNMAMGYTHFTAKAADGRALNSHHPRSMLKVHTQYQFSGGLQGLSIGGGAVWQSRTSRNTASPLGTVDVGQGSYVLAHAMARYEFNRQVAASIHVNNLFDKKYYEQQGFFSQGWWGAPRNAMLNVRVKY